MKRLAFALCLAFTLAPARAQEPPTKVDFFNGPVVSSNRVVGMGGAYIGVAEGADGHLLNPAAFGVRSNFAANDWFDWDVALSWLNVANSDDTDIDQSGRPGEIDDTRFLQLGFNLKFGRHGLGIHLTQQSYTIPTEEGDVVYQQTFGGPGYALTLEGGEWIVGGGVMVGTAAIVVADEELVSVEGGGLLFGVLWMPADQPYRMGVTARSRIVGAQVKGNADLVGRAVPDALEIPWQLGLGGSYMFGPRIYNLGSEFGEAPPTVARRYLLVAADLVLTGPTRDATGAQAFLDGTRQPAGRTTSYSARLGAESEIWANRMAARCGTYYEPSRFNGFDGRVHGTAGLDARITFYWDWKLSAVVDVADQYINGGLGLGFWH